MMVWCNKKRIRNNLIHHNIIFLMIQQHDLHISHPIGSRNDIINNAGNANSLGTNSRELYLYESFEYLSKMQLEYLLAYSASKLFCIY